MEGWLLLRMRVGAKHCAVCDEGVGDGKDGLDEV
jgi:hypothetical protein